MQQTTHPHTHTCRHIEMYVHIHKYVYKYVYVHIQAMQTGVFIMCAIWTHVKWQMFHTRQMCHTWGLTSHLPAIMDDGHEFTMMAAASPSAHDGSQPILSSISPEFPRQSDLATAPLGLAWPGWGSAPWGWARGTAGAPPGRAPPATHWSGGWLGWGGGGVRDGRLGFSYPDSTKALVHFPFI